jgi:hypothetical protein
MMPEKSCPSCGASLHGEPSLAPDMEAFLRAVGKRVLVDDVAAYGRWSALGEYERLGEAMLAGYLVAEYRS